VLFVLFPLNAATQRAEIALGASSSKKLMIRSTSRALKAPLMARSRSMLGPAAVVVMA
jgi:hypothetical protein